MMRDGAGIAGYTVPGAGVHGSETEIGDASWLSSRYLYIVPYEDALWWCFIELSCTRSETYDTIATFVLVCHTLLRYIEECLTRKGIERTLYLVGPSLYPRRQLS